MDQPFTYRPNYFVNPEGSTALQNLLNEAKADFFNKAFGGQNQNVHHNNQAISAVGHSDQRVSATQAKEALRA
jgi:hypothetical protein